MTQPAIAAPTPVAAPSPAPTRPAAADVVAPSKEMPAAPKAEKIRVRSHERAAKVKAQLDAEPAEPAAEREPAASSGQESSAADSASPKPDTPKAPDDAEKRREERKARILAAQEKERAQDAERSQHQRSSAKQRQAESEVEKLRKRVAELEPHEGVFRDEETLLAAAEAKGMTAEKLVQWMRRRLEDPNAVAQRQAQSVEQKLEAKLAEMQRRIDEREEAHRTERQQAQEQYEAQGKAHRFIEQARTAKDTHPLTAALQAKAGIGDAGLVAFANAFVAPHLHEGYSLQELHDYVEQLLDEVQVNGSGAPASGTSHPAKNGAAKPTSTLSNGVVSERVSATEEIPLARMPRRERVQRIKDILDRE